jgi:hypothetical protein
MDSVLGGQSAAGMLEPGYFYHHMYTRHMSKVGERRSRLRVIDLQTGSYGVMGIAKDYL